MPKDTCPYSGLIQHMRGEIRRLCVNNMVHRHKMDTQVLPYFKEKALGQQGKGDITVTDHSDTSANRRVRLRFNMSVVSGWVAWDEGSQHGFPCVSWTLATPPGADPKVTVVSTYVFVGCQPASQPEFAAHMASRCC